MDGIFGLEDSNKELIDFASKYLLKLGYTRTDINKTWEIVQEGVYLEVANKALFTDLKHVIKVFSFDHPVDITPGELYCFITL